MVAGGWAISGLAISLVRRRSLSVSTFYNRELDIRLCILTGSSWCERYAQSTFCGMRGVLVPYQRHGLCFSYPIIASVDTRIMMIGVGWVPVYRRSVTLGHPPFPQSPVHMFICSYMRNLPRNKSDYMLLDDICYFGQPSSFDPDQ